MSLIIWPHETETSDKICCETINISMSFATIFLEENQNLEPRTTSTGDHPRPWPCRWACEAAKDRGTPRPAQHVPESPARVSRHLLYFLMPREWTIHENASCPSWNLYFPLLHYSFYSSRFYAFKKCCCRPTTSTLTQMQPWFQPAGRPGQWQSCAGPLLAAGP